MISSEFTYKGRSAERNGNHSWLKIIADLGSYKVMFTSRGDVCDASAYSGFNICHYTGDSVSHITDCRRRLAEAVGVDVDRIIVPRQTHSVKVAVVSSLPVDDVLLEGVDGIVSILNKVVIGVSTADCVPVILVDETTGVVAALHAGWRGAVGGIVREGVGRMKELGAVPERTMAYIGPSICVDCFEVGEEVAEKFPDECVVRYDDGRRPHVDLPRYVVLMLEQEGVQSCNIKSFTKNICTRCHPDQYFSARALGVESGRNYTFVIKDDFIVK